MNRLDPPRIFSVGHSNHPIEKFIQLLRNSEIHVLVDIRSQPYSKVAPHFDSRPLREVVQASRMVYLFLGRELGGRPERDEFYDADGHVLYARVADTPTFRGAIQRLQDGIVRYRVAIMCSEENPTHCHRRLLVGRVLTQQGVRIDHIRGDGGIQTDDELGQSSVEKQAVLFGPIEETAWRSIRSASRRRRPPSSSER
jgi:uncharacterized protein (DUF488 family)